jgi:hypothetical protein
MFGGNPNKKYAQQGSITGGVRNTYKVNPGPVGGVNIYKTANGTRGLYGMDDAYYEREAGSGKFYRSSGNGWVQVSDYNAKPPEEEKPSDSGGSSGGSGSGSSGSYSSGYGTTNPYAGSTGSPGLDATTLALMKMVEGLTESLAKSKEITEADMEDVSKPAGEGLNSTILSQTYLPSSEKKKKSYLTPISVG